MPNEGLTDLVCCITIAEKSLIQAEEKARNLMGENKNFVSMEYEMKNKYVMLWHHFVGLSELLDILYRVRRSVRAQFDVDPIIGELIGLYKGAMVLEKTKIRFPPSGVYVDLDGGSCAGYFYGILAEYYDNVKRSGYKLHEDPYPSARQQIRDKLLYNLVNPLIGLLSDYDTHLEKRATTLGIYNSVVFEEVHSARWVEVKVENEPPGHYEMRNMVAMSKRPFLRLSSLVPILYSLKMCLRGHSLGEGESAQLYDQLKQLCDNPMFLLENPNVRFPAKGVFIDLAEGACSHDLTLLQNPNTAVRVSLPNILALVENYNSQCDKPRCTCGIYDRAHFEKHFSAKWIRD